MSEIRLLLSSIKAGSSMLPEEKWRQYGRPNMEVKGIVIHNTNVQKTAKELAKWMEQTQSSRGTHYFVDDKSTIQVMPLDWSVFNTGRGNDLGNTACISIEICSNLSDLKYLKGQERAVKLIKKLMKQYDLSIEDIYFHRDFQPNANCPAQILKIYGDKNNFIREVLNV